MNPLLLLAAAAAGGWLLFGTKPKQSGASISVKVPGSTTSTPVGNIKVTPTVAQQSQSGGTITIPEVTITPGPTVTTLPETTVSAKPADTSFLLTADEQNTLMTGTADQIYAAAESSSHEAFVAAAGLALAGKGDPRSSTVAQWVKDWPQQ